MADLLIGLACLVGFPVAVIFGICAFLDYDEKKRQQEEARQRKLAEARKRGELDDEGTLRERVKGVWGEVQRLAAECSHVQTATERALEVWDGVAPGKKGERYRDDFRENMQALKMLRGRLQEAANRGLGFYEVYVRRFAGPGKAVPAEVLSAKTVFRVAGYACTKCLYEDDGECALRGTTANAVEAALAGAEQGKKKAKASGK
ncbi:MAG TPA: hypothetical protein VMW72_05905 [Sedimentisphaerales bacterium]|nr:hypothetical protein [Sedimentisphaerales bacterium]